MQFSQRKCKDGDNDPKTIFPPYIPCFQPKSNQGFMEVSEGNHHFRTTVSGFQNKDTKRGLMEMNSVTLIAQPLLTLMLKGQETIR